MKNINNKTTAFSLIELSIVLIIIGLLVAGVTGGKSLIESAKTRALMNEIRGYKQAVNTYYAANGKLPGDKNNTGKIGNMVNADKYYTTTSCNNYSTADLYVEGIIDNFDNDNSPCYGATCSNIYKKADYSYLNTGDSYENHDCDFLSDNLYSSSILELNTNILKFSAHYDEKIPLKVGKAIDEKMDDGVHDSGSIRALNTQFIEYVEEYTDSPKSYEDALKGENYITDEMFFKLDLQ